MNVQKTFVAELNKCYCLLPIVHNGRQKYVIASEKNYPCFLIDENGKYEKTILGEPGGTMSMVYLPGTNGSFLATHKMYSPNDAKDASIVLVEPDDDPNELWKVTTLALLPFVHRFDILERNGEQYLIACTIKSDMTCKDDWSFPGKVYAAHLPGNFPHCNSQSLDFKVISDNMLKNHGYCRVTRGETQSSLITTEDGVFLYTPPTNPDSNWEIQRLLDSPVSDAILMDLDGDGQDELITLFPFHGDYVAVYHLNSSGSYEKVYDLDIEFLFAHAVCEAKINGKSGVVLGARRGNRDLIFLYHSGPSKGDYQHEVIDHDCGATNAIYCKIHGKDAILSANREINEIAFYTFD